MPSSENRKQRRLLERLGGYTGKTTPDPIDSYISRWLLRLSSFAITRRKWDGLPDSVDVRYLEKMLLKFGSAVIYSKDGEPTAQGVAMGGTFDPQENINERIGFGANGSTDENLNELNSVIVYDNILRVPVYSELVQYARDLARHDMEIMRNVAQQNSFYMLVVPREMKNDGERLMRNMGAGNAGVLVADDAIERVQARTLSTGVVPVMAELNDSKTHLYNECLSFLGIDYIPIEKKERLVTSEIEVAGDVIERQRAFFLDEARRAAVRMNDLFGWNVSVSWNTAEAQPSRAQETNQTGQDEQDEEEAE